MTDKIKIDIISDISCPWCLVGYKRLEQAMNELKVQNKFEIEWHPFELNPNISSDGEDIVEYLGTKYGMSESKVMSYQEDLKTKFAEVGFPFYFYKGKRVVSTTNAHILLNYAKTKGKQTELKIALFKANFADDQDVSKRDVLEQIIKSIGLDENEALLKLDDEKAKISIQEEERQWQEKGISAVPTMIFNNASMMNGAYPVGTYKQVLTELLTKNFSI